MVQRLPPKTTVSKAGMHTHPTTGSYICMYKKALQAVELLFY